MACSVNKIWGLWLLVLVVCAACAPQPSLDDPYAANGYYWPYEEGGLADEPAAPACELDADAPLGRTADGEPVAAMVDCPEGGMEMFPMWPPLK